ncbi:MAG: arginine--tRNA ligase [Candidatus Micrarchaeia archaeon]
MYSEENPYRLLVLSLAEQLAQASSSLGFSVSKEETLRSISLSKVGGDLSSSLPFKLSQSNSAEQFKADELAKKIAKAIKPGKLVKRVSSEKGFVNFHLDRKNFSIAVLNYLLAPSSIEGAAPGKEVKKVIIEYPSVNPNKPWHIGHLRNALLGNAISNTFKYLGYNVLRQDYIDDLGIQVMESLWGYMNLGSTPDKKFDHWLGEQYVEVNKRLEDKSVSEAIKLLAQSAEKQGTNEANMLFELVRKCVEAQYETAFSYGIYHDIMIWESDIVANGLLGKALRLLESKGVVETPSSGKYAGCKVINFEKLKEVPKAFQDLKENAKVLVRSDGTATYVAKDIAFHMWKLGMLEDTFKYKKFMLQPSGEDLYTTTHAASAEMLPNRFNGADVAINVIDIRQSYPQAVLKLALDALEKRELSERIIHLAYGEVELENGALSGRKGTWIGYSADDLLSEAKKKASSLITERFNLTGNEKESIASSVARAAIIFEFLKVSPEKKVIFSWERALNFEGNSGPYVQYMHARASRLLESAGPEALASAVSSLSKEEFNYSFENEKEFSLVKQISIFDEIVEKAKNELRPNILVEYANALALLFSAFYESLPVLKAENEEEKAARLLVTQSAKLQIGKALHLLGIDAVEKM